MGNTDFQITKENIFYGLVLIALLILLAFVISLSGADFGSGDTAAEDVDESISTCGLLEQNYCDMGIEFNYINRRAVGFAVPEGTPIYAPISGEFTSSGVGRVENVIGKITKSPENGEGGMLFTFVGIYEPAVESGSQVKAGDIIGSVVGDLIIEDIHNSTIVSYVQGISQDGTIYESRELLGRYFQ